MVSVVVPVFNVSRHLRRCIESLLAQRTTHEFEVIVSDDGSTDETRNLAREVRDHRIHWFFHDHVGLAANRNLGAARSNGTSLIFLDGDMAVDPAFIDAHTSRLQELGDSGVVIGRVPVARECLGKPLGRYLNRKWERRLGALAERCTDVFLMQGGNFSIQSEFFERIGGFSPTFADYGGEDIDFFVRAERVGARFAFSHEASAEHYVDLQFSSLLRKAGQNRISMDKVKRTHALEEPRRDSSRVGRAPRARGRVWSSFRKWSGSTRLLLLALPALERHAPDRFLFLVYDSLLAGAGRETE